MDLHPATHRSNVAFDRLSSLDAGALMANARALQLAAAAGQVQVSLRGKKLGLLCEVDTADAAMLFRGAAEALGAHVAHIRPSLSGLSTPQEVRHTARMLGRLYDAVECQDMAADLVQLVGADAGVPVYDGAASPTHPTARLAELLDGENTSSNDKRRFVLQAVLLNSIA